MRWRRFGSRHRLIPATMSSAQQPAY